MKKVLISILLLIVLLFQAASPVTAAVIETVTADDFTVKISCSDTDVDLSGIEIKVYSATLAFSESSSGYMQYDEEYAFSVYTNSQGSVVFDRPGDNFSITVDLSTLPENYAIDKHTKFFDAGTTKYNGVISEITSADIEYDNGEQLPVLLNKEGKSVYADAKITDQSITVKSEISTAFSGGKVLTYVTEYEITVDSKKYSVQKEDSYEYSSELDKAGFLYGIGVISEQEYMDELAKSILSEENVGYEEDLVCGTDLYYTLKNYYDSNVGIKTQLVNIELAINKLNPQHSSSANSRSCTLEYVLSESEHFRVYYCDCGATDCEYPSTQAKAQVLADLFDDIDYQFCTQWGFLRPYYTETAQYYYVYIVESYNAYAGATYTNGEFGSYINIDTDTVNNIVNGDSSRYYPNQSKGVPAHEYMHAIINRYGIHSSNHSDDKWLHESFATWAGIAFEGDYAARKASSVNRFLDSPSTSLTYFDKVVGSSYYNRHYGACLFPLFLDQSWGGYTYLRRILETRTHYNYTLDAIDVTLSYYGRSLDEAYTYFTNYLYDPAYYYDNIPTKGDDAWGQADREPVMEFPDYKILPESIQPLASHFIEYRAPSNTCSTLTLTIDYTNIPYDSIARLKTIRTTASGNHSYYLHQISNNRCTIVQQHFGSDTAKKLALIPINAGTVGSISYTRSAEAIYTPCDGTIYSINNVASGKYVNVHNGVDANNTNVYQFTPDGTDEQNFLIELKSNDTYHIRAMCSSNGTNRVLDIVKSGGSVVSGGNVQIYTATDAIAQEWLFYHVGDGKYKIVPASNEIVALTSYGTANGSSSGRTTTSAGNIFVSTYTGSNNQLWTFVPVE